MYRVELRNVLSIYKTAKFLWTPWGDPHKTNQTALSLVAGGLDVAEALSVVVLSVTVT